MRNQQVYVSGKRPIESGMALTIRVGEMLTIASCAIEVEYCTIESLKSISICTYVQITLKVAYHHQDSTFRLVVSRFKMIGICRQNPRRNHAPQLAVKPSTAIVVSPIF